MVTQYPHTATVKVLAESTKDGNGNWIEQATTDAVIACRAEPSNGNSFLPGDDGTRIYYSFIVYAPLPIETIKPGTAVVVNDGALQLCNETVKRFHRGQLNARIWL